MREDDPCIPSDVMGEERGYFLISGDDYLDGKPAVLTGKNLGLNCCKYPKIEPPY